MQAVFMMQVKESCYSDLMLYSLRMRTHQTPSASIREQVMDALLSVMGFHSEAALNFRISKTSAISILIRLTEIWSLKSVQFMEINHTLGVGNKDIIRTRII